MVFDQAVKLLHHSAKRKRLLHELINLWYELSGKRHSNVDPASFIGFALYMDLTVI